MPGLVLIQGAKVYHHRPVLPHGTREEHFQQPRVQLRTEVLHLAGAGPRIVGIVEDGMDVVQVGMLRQEPMPISEPAGGVLGARQDLDPLQLLPDRVEQHLSARGAGLPEGRQGGSQLLEGLRCWQEEDAGGQAVGAQALQVAAPLGPGFDGVRTEIEWRGSRDHLNVHRVRRALRPRRSVRGARGPGPLVHPVSPAVAGRGAIQMNPIRPPLGPCSITCGVVLPCFRKSLAG
mmetsp:Transcript_150545/g.263093  ORF Transcript_150545/g.263093 Transcript_150545/m.263093 type:complete len:233 (-) Transcript_150545:29-727(-)